VTDRPLAGKPDGPVDVPDLVRAFCSGAVSSGSVSSGDEPEAVWLNDLGGLTFRLGDWYLKWNPFGSGRDLTDDLARLEWAAPRHPVPEVVDFQHDERGQVLVTRALPGAGAVTETWRARPRDAVRAIAEGLRKLHELPVAECPFECGWAATGVLASDPVVVQGDACAPNTIIGPDARFAGHVDLGSLGRADRWADLAVASMSLEWNFGHGWQGEFFAAYGVARDEQRIRQYRALWNDAP
jgi:kanamycin kinase